MDKRITTYRKTQEQALQLMCLLDAHSGLTADEAYVQYYRYLYFAESEIERNHSSDQSLEINSPITLLDQQRLANILVSGARNSIQKIDELLKKASHHWRLERMTWVDRNLLRLAVYELETCLDIPAQMIIHEAIELAKRFSTENSPSFINGILDKIKTELNR